MLKDLSNVFDKKRKFFSESKDKDWDIKEILKTFLQKEFGENLKGFSFIVRYNPKDNSLIITTDNKIIANELSLRLVDLSSVLKDRGIRLGRILIK
jgi:hypothetical protein